MIAQIFSSERAQAQILWRQTAFVEYIFPPLSDANDIIPGGNIRWKSVRMPGLRTDYPSDITAGSICGSWNLDSPGDMGCRRGVEPALVEMTM